MAEIKLFNEYHGRENTITNYCGLMLKLLYQSSPTNFEKCISELIEDDINLIVGPIFSQQVSLSSHGENRNIADLAIQQSAYDLIFEVKNYDWFYDEQFVKYIENLKKLNGDRQKVLFALTNEFKEDRIKGIKKMIEGTCIKIQFITFSILLDSLEKNKVNYEIFERFLEDFRDFLLNQGLLESWKDLLEVVNCASTIDKVVANCFYTCPDKKGQYSHSRAKYFGPYKERNVKFIFEIDGVVSVDINLQATVKYNNINKVNDLEKRAIDYISNCPDLKKELENHDLQVFILSNKIEMPIGFKKGTPGGLFGNKIYFRGIAKGLKNSDILAKKLDGKNWEDF